MFWWVALAALLVVCYVAVTWQHDFFRKRGLQFDPPWPLVGNFARLLRRKEPLAEFLVDSYTRYKQYGMYGIFEFLKPVTIVCDPEIIKLITVKDADYFLEHRTVITEDVDPLIGKNLISLQGHRWRNMRATLSPAFTSSKMKSMFVLVEKCGQQMADYLISKSKEEESGMVTLEMKDFFTRYANDVIATAAFGVHVDSLAEPDNEFYEMGKSATTPTGKRMLVFMGYSFVPQLMKLLKFTLLPAKINEFFRTLVRDTVEARDRLNIVRPDMIHLLMQAQRGTLKHDDSDDGPKPIELTNDDITAQAVLFFFGGFDTSSTLLCFVTQLLAQHQDVQRRAQAELDEVLKEHDGNMTYDALQKLKYMDQIISETLRLYPPAPVTDRRCISPYKMAATMNTPALKVNTGDGFWIPIYAIQRDPEYFDRPDEFDPDRFSDENKHKINPGTYLPFGLGPRNCIGMRFGQMEAKIAVASLLRKFDLEVVEKTCVPLVLDPKAFNMAAKGGFWLGLKPRLQS